ncbi:MAG: helix-hairpin-helix domain-containing protein [Thalassolituus sp.]
MKGIITSVFFAAMLIVMPAKAQEQESSAQQGPVKINSASAAELSELKGVGEAKAQAIIAYREEHGDFEKLEDLTKVKGIGESILKSNAPLLSLE